MQKCDIYHGAIRHSEKCCGIGCVNSSYFIVCCLNENVVIFDRNFKKLQNITSFSNFCYEDISSIVCCQESGKIFISGKNFFVTFYPIYTLQDDKIINCKWEKLEEVKVDFNVNTGEWYCNGTRLIISTGNYLEIYEINYFNNNISTKNIQEQLTNKIWRYYLPSPVTIISSSNDSMFFATAGNFDTKVIIWYQMASYLSSTIDNKLMFDFTILNHPTYIINFEWRKIPKEIFRYEIENCIITFCKDNIARVWKENILNEELYIDCDVEQPSDIIFESSKIKENDQKRKNYFKKMMENILVNSDDTYDNTENEVKKLSLINKKNLNNDTLNPPLKMKKVFFHIVSSIVSENIPDDVDIYGNSTKLFTPHWLNNKYLAFLINFKEILNDSNFCEDEADDNSDNKSSIISNIEKFYDEWKKTSDGLFSINEKTGTLTIWNIFNLDSYFKSSDTKLISSIQNVLSISHLPSKISSAFFLPFDTFNYHFVISEEADNLEKNNIMMDDANSNLLVIYSDGRIDISQTNVHYQSNLTFLESINHYTSLYGAKYSIENITSYLDLCLTMGSRKNINDKEYQLEIILWKIDNNNNNKETKHLLEEISRLYLNVSEYHNKITWLRNKDNDLRNKFPLTFAMYYDGKLNVYEIYENNVNVNRNVEQEYINNSTLMKSILSIDINKYGIDNIFCLQFTTPGEFFLKRHSELNYLFIIGKCNNLKNPKIILWEYDEKCLNVNFISIEYFNEENISNIFIIQKDKSITGMMFDYTNYPQICLQTTNNLFYFYNITKECIFTKNNGMTFQAPMHTLASAIYDGRMAILKKCNNELILDIYECRNLNGTMWKKESFFIFPIESNINKDNVLITWVLGAEKGYKLCIQIYNEIHIFLLSLHNTLLLICRFFLNDKYHYPSMEWLENNKFLVADGNALELCSLNENSLNNLKNKNIQYHPDYLVNLIETNNMDIVNIIFKNILNQITKYKKYSKNNIKTIYIEPIPENEIKKLITLRDEKITLDEYIEKKEMEEKKSCLEGIFNIGINCHSQKGNDLFDNTLSFNDNVSIHSDDFNIDISSDDEIDSEKSNDEEYYENKNNIYSLENVELTESDCKELSNILMKIGLAGLCKEEIYQLISIAEALNKYFLIKDNIAYDYCGKKYYIFLQFFSSLKKLDNSQIFQLPSSTIVWAFHSTSENELFENVLIEVNDDMCWKNLKNYGIGWWLRHPDNLKKCFEKLAHHAYLKKNNPMDAAIYYMILRKKNVIATLFRKQNDTARSNFFAQSYETEKDKIFAMKNAFNCISKGEYFYAVAIFLCCNDIENALKVVMERLNDIQLGIMIIRTYIINVYEQEKYIENIILKYILNLTRQKIDKWKNYIKEDLIKIDEGDILFDEDSNDDPYLRSMAFFIIKEYHLSSLTLLHYEKSTKKYPTGGLGSLSCQLTSLFTLYKYLLKHPYVLRQKKFLCQDVISRENF
ncbi:DmX-like protein 1 [Strongyloides ratti]|uniref:DmX-like protein 1 n=1 Tax=Strongyloides ratti TaxID=34506 RepID=A0A090KXW4_STRRB|nr:DmX-like protein 1 [Strongyloides ratti]CEF62360.1 DmX-like protein 1 [Strongyloides ratti]